MRTTVEHELKLDPGPEFAFPDLPGEPLASRVFTSTYYDTPPRSLLRAGITLRRRLENGVNRWQLKLPRDAPARTELEALGGPAGPPGELRALLTAHLRHGAFEPVATLRTRRTGVRVRDTDHALADVTLDAVAVLEGARETGGFAELEIELVDGDADDLDRLSRVLRRAGAERSDGQPKLLRVVGRTWTTPADGETPSERVRLLILQQLVAIESADPGVRLGDDPEDVHRMRVATRRARALARATEPLYGERLAPLADELKWLGGLLGDVRDLDVLIEHLREEAHALDADAAAAEALVAQLDQDREACRARLLEGLASERYQLLLREFDDAVSSLPDVDAHLQAIAARQLKKLRRAAEALPDEPSDDELHGLRKKAKKARYAGELALLDGGKPLERYVSALKDLQDVIGEHQDAVVAEERLRQLARARTALAAGRLIDRERERRADARAAYADVLAAVLKRGKRAT